MSCSIQVTDSKSCGDCTSLLHTSGHGQALGHSPKWFGTISTHDLTSLSSELRNIYAIVKHFVATKQVAFESNMCSMSWAPTLKPHFLISKLYKAHHTSPNKSESTSIHNVIHKPSHSAERDSWVTSCQTLDR